MERVYIQWNIPNWITVFLMVLIGTTAIAAASSAAKSYMGSG